MNTRISTLLCAGALGILLALPACTHVKILPGSYKPAESSKAAVALHYNFAPPVPVIFSRIYFTLRSRSYKTDEKVEFSHKSGFSATKTPKSECVLLQLAAPHEWSVDYIAYGTERAVIVPTKQNPVFFDVQPGKLYWLGSLSSDSEKFLVHDPDAGREKCVKYINEEYSGLQDVPLLNLESRRQQIEDVYFF